MSDRQDTMTFLWLLTEAQVAMGRLFEHRVRDLGLNRQQWRVLTGLVESEGQTQTELANLVGIARSPLGKIVDRLEEAGLVERRPDEHDRRVNRLFVTDAVAPLVEPARTAAQMLDDQALAEVPDRAELMACLTQVRDTLRQLTELEFSPNH